MADVKLPGLGPVNKKALVVGGAIGAVVLAVAYSRHRSAAAAAAAAAPADQSAADDTGADIDPTTGFPYGSVQDQEALAAVSGGVAGQLGDVGDLGGLAGTGTSSDIDPVTGFPYGSPQDLAALGLGTTTVPPDTGTGTTTGTGAQTVAEWEQAAIADMSAAGVSAAVLSAATSGIPRYLAGLPLTDAQASAVQQAVALAGEPPGGPYTIKRTPAPPKPTTHTITANGKDDLYKIATDNHITEGQLVSMNLSLAHYVGSKKPIPAGTKVKV
jgi:LysM repeat protein